MDRQMNENDFIGNCPANIERPEIIDCFLNETTEVFAFVLYWSFFTNQHFQN